MTISNLEKYRDDLAKLIGEGETVKTSLLKEAYIKDFRKVALDRHNGDEAKADESLNKIKAFKTVYHHWYSEALVLVKQLLPDRLADFVRLYEKPKTRKSIDFENYRIEDALQGLRSTFGGQVKADMSAAVNLLDQQIAIVESIQRRFESSLFDIKQLVRADLFDSELDTARELLKNKFIRGAGAIAGVVLEQHLGQVCENHNIKLGKKHPGIADYNEALKTGGVIDVAQWRFNQHLGDIRNLCDHSKTTEPSQEQVRDLIEGVAKVAKTTF